MGDKQEIKRRIAYYMKKFCTNDPFQIADRLGVLYQIGNCKNEGCYMYLKKTRYIFLSNQLAHAIFDTKQNCYFIRNKTLLLNSKIEKRANTFAAYLLITDELLHEYAGFTQEQFCQCTGYPKELIELRLK